MALGSGGLELLRDAKARWLLASGILLGGFEFAALAGWQLSAAIGDASRRGALIKCGGYVEAIGNVKVVALDKTRTLTRGKPKVMEVGPFGASAREHLLACAAGIESHPEQWRGWRGVWAAAVPAFSQLDYAWSRSIRLA